MADDDRTGLDRRTVLKRASAVAVGGLGVSAASGTGAAKHYCSDTDGVDVDYIFDYTEEPSFVAGETIEFQARLDSDGGFSFDSFGWTLDDCHGELVGNDPFLQQSFSAGLQGLYLTVGGDDPNGDSWCECWGYPLEILDSPPAINVERVDGQTIEVSTPQTGYDSYEWTVTESDGSSSSATTGGASATVQIGEGGSTDVSLVIRNAVGSETTLEIPYRNDVTVDLAAVPEDLDGDGDYEDVDGDGTLTEDDSHWYDAHRDESFVEDDPGYDIDGDGTSGTVFDAVELYNESQE